jgi:hypothetical protein
MQDAIAKVAVDLHSPLLPFTAITFNERTLPVIRLRSTTAPRCSRTTPVEAGSAGHPHQTGSGGRRISVVIRG